MSFWAGIRDPGAECWNTGQMTDHTTPEGVEYFTLGEAVKQVKASRSTIQRALKAGKVRGASMNDAGVWRIPFDGLVAAGFASRFISATDTTTGADDTTVSLITEPTAELPTAAEDLAAEVVRLRAEVHYLKALAADRAADMDRIIDRLTMVLVQGPASLEADPVKPRRRWWGRPSK